MSDSLVGPDASDTGEVGLLLQAMAVLERARREIIMAVVASRFCTMPRLMRTICLSGAAAVPHARDCQQRMLLVRCRMPSLVRRLLLLDRQPTSWRLLVMCLVLSTSPGIAQLALAIAQCFGPMVHFTLARGRVQSQRRFTCRPRHKSNFSRCPSLS